nr:hypothetical protein CFP56_70219 [Quercus suber]
MEAGADEDDAATGAGGLGGAGVLVACGRRDEVRQHGFGCVEGPQRVDVHDRFERVRAQLTHRRQEIARRASDAEIDPAEFARASLGRCLQSGGVAHVHGCEAEDFGSWSDQGDVGRAGFSLLDVAPDDAGVSSEGDEGPDLHGTDGAGATGAEEDFVGVQAIAPDGG